MRDGGEAWGNEESEKRIEKGSRERIEIERRQKGVEMTFEEEEEEHHHLPMLVVQLPQGTAVLLRRHEFPTRFYSIVLQH